MRILVTGATGFIGKPLIRLLKQNGFFIRTTNRNLENNNTQNNSSINEIVLFDLSTDENDYKALLEDIDVVIHLAAKVHNVSASKKDPEEYFRINAGSTEKLAKLASQYGVKRFIFLSSIKVNGESTICAFKEDDDPCPQGAYAKSKLAAEEAIRKICHESKMNFIILRPTLVYGPDVKANFLYLLDIINKNYPLPLASVKNKRSLLYVENLVYAIAACVKHTNVENKTYLISDIDISVPKLIVKISTLFGKRALLFPFPIKLLKVIGSLVRKRSIINRLTDSMVADSSLLKRDINWMPPNNFDDGLKETIDWYLKR